MQTTCQLTSIAHWSYTESAVGPRTARAPSQPDLVPGVPARRSQTGQMAFLRLWCTTEVTHVLSLTTRAPPTPLACTTRPCGRRGPLAASPARLPPIEHDRGRDARAERAQRVWAAHIAHPRTLAAHVAHVPSRLVAGLVLHRAAHTRGPPTGNAGLARRTDARAGLVLHVPVGAGQGRPRRGRAKYRAGAGLPK